MANLNKRFKNVENPIANQKNVIYFDNYRVTVLFPCLFRIERSEQKRFEDKATQCVFFRNMDKVHFQSEQRNGSLFVTTEKVTLCLTDNLQNSYIDFYDKKVYLDGKGNLKGTARTLDCMMGNINRYDGSELEVEDGICSRTGVALFDDSESLVIEKDGSMAERVPELDVYVFAFGSDYKGAVKALYSICGSVPLFPRFALGNWWSRYHDYSDKEYLSLMDKFIDADIPFTVGTIDMDWHYSDSLAKDMKIEEKGRSGEFYGGVNGWTGYTWNKELFPNYKNFLRRVKDKNLKVTLNVHPAQGVRWFEDAYADFAKKMEIDPESGECIPFDMTNSEFVNNYFKILHRPYEKDGVDFWWIDWQQGEQSKKKGVDPLLLLNHYHYLDNSESANCPIILSRYFGVGAHRYPLGFSGDTLITWKTLKYLPYFTATASNVGYGWWSHDIGGHFYGVKDDELYLRSVQMGVFMPILRLHSCNDEMMSKEPWNYRNGIGELAAKALRFRHSLVPYLYSLAYKCNTEGEMLVEPMYYYYDCEKAYEYKNQYFFGGLLVLSEA